MEKPWQGITGRFKHLMEEMEKRQKAEYGTQVSRQAEKVSALNDRVEQNTQQIGAVKDQLGAVKEQLGAVKDQLGAMQGLLEKLVARSEQTSSDSTS